MASQKKEKRTVTRRKSLPHDTNAEKAVLGAILTNEELAAEAFTRLEVEDFYPENTKHQLIYTAMLRVYNNHQPVDFQTVCDELILANALELAGGTDYLFDLGNTFVGYENAKHCIMIVYNQAMLRHYLESLKRIEERYYNTQIEDIGDFLSESEKELEQISRGRTVADWKSTKFVTDALLNNIEHMKKASEDGVIGVPTGYEKLNELIHGFRGGQMIILAARPAVGKTAFGLNLCYNAAVKQHTVAYFSLEMSAEQLMTRIVSTESRVNQDKINLGMLTAVDKTKLAQACEAINGFKFFIDDTAGIKINDLIAKTRKLKKEHPDLGLVVVDYIGLVRVSEKTGSNDSRQMIIQETSQELKRLALELNIAILVVAQLNRGVEQRENGVPMLSDLRESGSLEQDADVVMLMYSESLRKKKPKFGQQDDGKFTPDSQQSIIDTELSKMGGSTQLVNINVAKNRQGKTGTVYLLFKKDIGRFDNPDRNFLEQLTKIKAGIIPSKDSEE